MIADIMTNKSFQAIIIGLFIGCRKLNKYLVLITQSYFSIPKEIGLNSTHNLVTKIHNKRELRNIAINHSSDIGYKDYMNIHKTCTGEPYYCLTIDTTLPTNNPLRFRKNILDLL